MKIKVNLDIDKVKIDCLMIKSLLWSFKKKLINVVNLNIHFEQIFFNLAFSSFLVLQFLKSLVESKNIFFESFLTWLDRFFFDLTRSELSWMEFFNSIYDFTQTEIILVQ